MACVLMDPDNDAPPQPARRPSAAHDRPSRTPFGPRIRTKTRPSTDVDTPTSPLSSSALSRPDSPHQPDLSIDTLPAYADAAVQTPPPPAIPTTTAPPPQRPAPATFVAPPPLTPPPPITFESTPIPWKGLPYDAAQWTFSSSELQEIVSKAIRLSARESFVRLLSPQALEVDIVHEAERLQSERAAAQAKWRFEVSRRTMFMQALNSSTASSVPGGNGNGEPDGVPRFVAQLASSVASCDSVLSSILHCLDQQSQVAIVQHQHWASALGVALRKLNKAYERQGQELKRVQARVHTLEDELEEAWREAEKMAIEFDQLEQEVAVSEHGSEGDDDDDGGERPHPGTAPSQHKPDLDDTGTLGDGTINTDIAVVVGVTATAVASKATLVNSPGSPRHNIDRSDAKSVRSVKSTRSRWSTRDGQSHLSRMSAARTRSRAASNASLRLPKALRSTPATLTPPVDAPPVPARPPANGHGQSFLDMGTAARDRLRKGLPPPRHPEPSVALPTPPHSAGLPSTRVPSVWLEEADNSARGMRLNGLDRTHSLQIFSSLTSRTPKKTRRSNLVMSLTGSDRGAPDSAVGSPTDVASGSGSGDASGAGSSVASAGAGTESSSGSGSGTVSGTGASAGPGATSAGADAGAASPLSTSSPMSLPTYALTNTHCRGLSVSSSNVSVVGVGAGARPGSAGARLTSSPTAVSTPTVMATSMPVPVPVVFGTPPRRSLVSRASSVLLKRLSQATAGSKERLSPSRSREALRLSGSGRSFVERWREREREREREGQGSGASVGEEEEEGEVMLIGSPLTELLEPTEDS